MIGRMPRKAAALTVCLLMVWGNVRMPESAAGKEIVRAEETKEDDGQGKVYLGIDSVHTYETMNSPFSQGYLREPCRYMWEIGVWRRSGRRRRAAMRKNTAKPQLY